MISVIIPTLNRPDTLAHALTSLSHQTYRDFETIVVNDGGPSARHIVDHWRRELTMTLLELPSRSGPARARNIAIDHASGDFLAFLDDDDLFLPTHLETAHQTLTGVSTVDFVYLSALVSGDRLDSDTPLIEGSPHQKAYPFNEPFLHVANYLHTGAVVTRTFRDTSVRFDEALTHCEDWDMWLALRLRLGLEMRHVNALTTVYHQIRNSGSAVQVAQQENPTPFSIARERIHRKWPSSDSQVREYRAWMDNFELHRNMVNASGLPVPVFLFDRVLAYLYPRFVKQESADAGAIPGLFSEP